MRATLSIGMTIQPISVSRCTSSSPISMSLPVYVVSWVSTTTSLPMRLSTLLPPAHCSLFHHSIITAARLLRGSCNKKGAGFKPAPFYVMNYSSRLNVVIQEELVRMGSEPQRVNFPDSLVVDPRLDNILGKDIALLQKIMVFFKTVKGVFERAW